MIKYFIAGTVKAVCSVMARGSILVNNATVFFSYNQKEKKRFML